MMRKELLVSGGMASILTAVTGVVIYFHGGDPTTDVPAAETAAAEQKQQASPEPSVPGWPAPVPANSAASGDAKSALATNTTRSSLPDIAAGSTPWSKPAADAKPTVEETAKDTPKPFGANEAADAASAFSSRFKSDVASIEKKIDEAIPNAGPELKPAADGNANPLRNPQAATAPTSSSSAPANSASGPVTTTPAGSSSTASTPAASPFGAPPAITTEPRTPVAATPASPVTSPFGKPAPAATSTAPANNVASTTSPMRAPTSEDLQWRPMGSADSPPRVTSDLTGNPLRSQAAAPAQPIGAPGSLSPDTAIKPQETSPSFAASSTLPTLPHRDASTTQVPARPAQTAPQQPVQLASTIPVSTPPRVVPIPAGTRTQQLGRVYTVEEGDTLADIARRELGNSARAGEIQTLNREVLGGSAFLRPGLELILPR